MAWMPIQFPIVFMEMVTQVDGLKVKKIGEIDKHKAWRWQKAKPLASKSLMKAINNKKKL